MEKRLGKEIGEKIRELRGKKSLRRLGQALDVDPSYISKIENGRIPSMKLLEQMAAYFGVEVSYFFGEEQEITQELKDVGVEWVTFIKDMKKEGLTPKEIKNILKIVEDLKGKL